MLPIPFSPFRLLRDLHAQPLPSFYSPTAAGMVARDVGNSPFNRLVSLRHRLPRRRTLPTPWAALADGASVRRVPVVGDPDDP